MPTKLSQMIAACYKRGGKVLICGNGGLAAESDHFAAELMGKYGKDVHIPAVSLTSNGALITAIANDYGFQYVFSAQAFTLGKPEDLLICMTTSQSSNILQASRITAFKTILLNRDTVGGNDVAEIQENILKLLHQVAREAKELISDGPNTCQS